METWEWIVLVVGDRRGAGAPRDVRPDPQAPDASQERFGPEYQRAVADQGTGGGEKRLHEIESERKDLQIRPLPPAARDRYLDEWRQAEARFVSDPVTRPAPRSALVIRALEERGYPREDDNERLVALVSVDHPDVADRYRHGHAMLDNVDGSREHREPPQGDARLPQRARGRRRGRVAHGCVARGRRARRNHGAALRRSPRRRTGVRRS